MLEIYLSRNTSRNQKLLSFCDSHGISYSCKEVSHLSREELLRLFTKSSDCFTLLSPSLQRFKGHREMKLSELMTVVLRKPEQNLRLPIVVCEYNVYPDMSLEEVRTFLPRSQKVVSFREHLFKDLVTLGGVMNDRFWENLEIIVMEKGLSWADLARQMFKGQYVYPSEFNRLYQTFRHYKSHRLMPQGKWVEKIVTVLEIDYEDLFRR